jgi:hypothetical protein
MPQNFQSYAGTENNLDSLMGDIENEKKSKTK